MRGKVAKQLRKRFPGAKLTSEVRPYGIMPKDISWPVIDFGSFPASYIPPSAGTVICTGERKIYQQMKRSFKEIVHR